MNAAADSISASFDAGWDQSATGVEAPTRSGKRTPSPQDKNGAGNRAGSPVCAPAGKAQRETQRTLKNSQKACKEPPDDENRPAAYLIRSFLKIWHGLFGRCFFRLQRPWGGERPEFAELFARLKRFLQAWLLSVGSRCFSNDCAQKNLNANGHIKTQRRNNKSKNRGIRDDRNSDCSFCSKCRNRLEAKKFRDHDVQSVAEFLNGRDSRAGIASANDMLERGLRDAACVLIRNLKRWCRPDGYGSNR